MLALLLLHSALRDVDCKGYRQPFFSGSETVLALKRAFMRHLVRWLERTFLFLRERRVTVERNSSFFWAAEAINFERTVNLFLHS